MPFVVPALIAAGVAGGFAVAAGATATILGSVFLGAAIPAFAASVVLGGLSSVLAKKPDAPSSPTIQAQGRLITVRQPISPWQWIYGEARVGGDLTFIEESADKQYLHMVITMAGSDVAALTDVRFNGQIVDLDSDGNTAGLWAPYARVRKSLGDEGAVQPFPDLVSESAGVWTSSWLQQGRAKLYVRLKSDQNVFPSGVPNITVVARGREVYDPRTATTIWSDNPALCLADYLTNSSAGLAAVYADEIDETQLIAAANVCDERVPLAGDTVAFTADDTEDTIALGAAKRPNTGEGVRVSSDGALPTGLSAGVTYYVIHAGWVEASDGVPSGERPLLKLATSHANARAGTAIDITDAGTGAHTLTYYDEPRYSLSGSFRVNQDPKDILEKMLASMAGMAVHIGGKWHIFAGAYEVPTITLDEGDLAGPIRVQSLISRAQNANAVKGVFVDPNNGWQPTDFPAVASDTYLEEDNSERVWRDIDLSGFTTSPSMAQRLAKIELLRLRQGLTVSATFKLTAYRAMTGGTVALTNTKFGWSGKAFEIVGSRFIVAPDGTLAVGLDLRETAAAVYDWSSSEEQAVDLAPNTTLPDPANVVAPGVPTVTELLYETRDGRGLAVQATVSAITSDPYATHIQFEYKLSSASTWIQMPSQPVAAAGMATAEIPDIAPGVYNFRGRAINTHGVRSSYSPTRNQEIVGMGDRPEEPQEVALQAAGGLAIVTLTAHEALDVRRGGRILVRHSESTVGATWEESFSIGNVEGYAGDSTIIVLPLKAGTYLLKARDAIGLESEDFAEVTTKQASVLAFSTLDDLQEDDDYTGTHDNTVVDDGTLKMLGSGLFDDIPDFDSMSNFDSFGGIVAAGSYQFATGFDFGGVERARITGQIEGFTENVNDLFDDREGEIDDWLDFDGAGGGGSTDAFLESRETDDDPGGAPVWGEWTRLDASEHECWGMELRLRMISYDPAYNQIITMLRAHAEQVT